MAGRLRALHLWRALMTLASISALLGLAAELGHLQWTSGGPSGLRGRGIPFNASGLATWRESGVSMSRGAIGIWTAKRAVAKDNYDWGDGGALFFGVNDELGGPLASEGTIRWAPQIGLGGLRKGTIAGNGTWIVTVPLWPLAALFLIGGVLVYRRASIGPDMCSECGYDLRGLGDRSCPECATPSRVNVPR